MEKFFGLSALANIMEKFYLYIIVFASGFIIGYILKDLLTVEKKTVINVKKQKVKGTGNTLDAVIDVEVKEKKVRKKLTDIFKRRKLRKN